MHIEVIQATIESPISINRDAKRYNKKEKSFLFAGEPDELVTDLEH